ncbi:hypothetical protein [Glutamicibacter endophyticus]|uniref:hypothetical protein n=1 Tax=Glutamicibacter endophyticus TaxID=1522174 RepID=UPI003AEF6C8F
MKKLLKAALVGTMSTGLLLGVGVPAQASQSYGFNTATTYGQYNNDGQAHTKGTITYHGKYAFTYNVGVRDLCGPDGRGDGYGAYVQIMIRHMDGTSKAGNVAHDNNGCGTTFRWFKEYNKFGKKIRWVQVRVYEYDADTGHIKDSSTTRRIDNPYTG